MSGTVTVGCKLPNGLIIHRGDVRVTLKGTNQATIVGGHGITTGVDADFWNAWIAENAEYAPVKGGFVFAHENRAYVEAQAVERSKEKTGLEPLSPLTPGQGIEPTDSFKEYARGEGLKLR